MKQNKQQILRAIEAIQIGRHEFCCIALSSLGSFTLRESFESIFAPEWCQNPGDLWTFVSDQNNQNISPMPSTEEQINIRLTALWLFYHMQ